MRLIAIAVMLAVSAFAQQTATDPTTPQPKPSIADIGSAVTSLNNIAPASFLLAQVAANSTDWHFTSASGRVYNVSVKQQVALTGAVLGAALVVRHLWPKTAKVVDGVLMVTSGALAGKAYANAQSH